MHPHQESTMSRLAAVLMLSTGLIGLAAVAAGAADRPPKSLPRWGVTVGWYGWPSQGKFDYEPKFEEDEPTGKQSLEIERGVTFGAFYDRPFGRVVRIGIHSDWYRVAWRYEDLFGELQQDSALLWTLGAHVKADVLAGFGGFSLRPGGGVNYGRLPETGIRFDDYFNQPYRLNPSKYLAWQADLEVAWTCTEFGLAIEGGAVWADGGNGEFDTSVGSGTYVRFALFKTLP
jgi:hypothetical protein